MNYGENFLNRYIWQLQLVSVGPVPRSAMAVGMSLNNIIQAMTAMTQAHSLTDSVSAINTTLRNFWHSLYAYNEE